MWIFSAGTGKDKAAFMSAVQYGDDPNWLVVRTRDRISAKQLSDFCGADVVENAGTDYPFRVFVSRAELTAYMTQLIQGINYGNFKNAVTKSRGQLWHDAAMDVWVAMLKVAPRRRVKYSTGKRATGVY